MTTHFRLIEKEITAGNHISSHLYQISSEKKYNIISKKNSKYIEWEKYLHDNFPFNLSNYYLRALTPPSPGGVQQPALSLVYKNFDNYDSNHLKLFGVNNKNNFPINFGMCKNLYDIGKITMSRCCFTYNAFLKTNHFMVNKLNTFIETISKYCNEITIPSAICFSIDENGEIYDDTIHVQYPCENRLIIKNLAKSNSSLKQFLINEYGVVEDKINLYNFYKYYSNYREGKFYYIKIAISETKNPIVKFYRHTKF